MRATYSIHSVLLVLTCLMSSAAAGVEVDLPRIDLDPDDELRLARAACGGPLDVGAARIDAYEYGATVECASHGRYAAHPLFAETDCESKDDRWTCRPPRYGIRIATREGDNRIMLNDVTPKEAVEIVRYLDELPVYAGKPIRPAQIGDIVQIWRLEENRFRVHARSMGHLFSIQRNCEKDVCVHGISSLGFIDY